MRTTSDAVIAVLGDDYGFLADGETLPVLTPFIEAASAIVDRIVTCAATRDYTLSSTEQELIERWLAAHMFKLSDRQHVSRSTNGASASFGGQLGTGFEFTSYGQMALRLDPSGCLSSLDKRQTARMIWLGKPPSAQTPYEQRN